MGSTRKIFTFLFALAAITAAGCATNLATLAIMNGHPPNEPPRSGERLKIVVGG